MTAPIFRAAASSPLVQFFAAGAVIFGLYALGPGSETEAADEIVVTVAEQRNLAALFEQTWRRQPSADEIDILIASRLDEELLYREALALGLDTDDVVVRRRLAQKVEFLIDDLSARRDPTEAELAAFLAEHADRYAIEPAISFRQIYLSPERRGERVLDDAGIVLAALEGGTDPAALGDAAPLPDGMKGASVSRIAQVFGEDFADALGSAPLGRWTGPVPSTYGVHLIQVERREPGRMPSLAEARAGVESDWRDARRREARAAYLAQLRAKYEIRVEEPGARDE
ncbi:peptidyl-prolyl cis-trans isomerase [Limibaculum sp. M0105]|uniref:Parvulin-like PPIase n=1 Tax=Thermohalobaculum xanthum TaxID=2753746 RepID=A0A8J7M649_9RHOB|nr:peptidylprolyl isomerase [Thermohalobaculum xanthum]MBK0399044.1 peptidyl-prolyl cis-trans isomerase [Thermohalobaculum xanthum]